MSLAAAEAFRQRLNEDPSLRTPFLHAYEQSAKAVVELASQHAFDFTEEELLQELAVVSQQEVTPFERELTILIESRQRGELNDEELELVSAGGAPACTVTTTSGSRP